MRVRRVVHVLLWGVGLTLTGCRHAETDQEFLMRPPPVISDLVLASDFSGDHDHAGAPSDEVVAGPITVHAVLSHSVYGKSYPERLLLKVDLVGAADKPKERPRLNLALVFDRSGSMADDQKFMHAVQAARMVVENLSDRDVISLIAFNERAAVLSPAGRAVNKAFLQYRLGQFGPEGNTNLSAGLLEAFAQIESQSADGQSKRVIVLTDGLANRGVTDPAKLRKLVAAAHARGIGLSTVGCGTEFDEKVLTDLAAAGGGRYTYVRSGEMIPNAIAAELDGLLDVVAQNVKLDIRVASGGAITHVYGRLVDDRMSAYAVELGDIRDGERSSFLLQLTPDALAENATLGVDVTLTLDDPETGTRSVNVLHSSAAFSTDVDAAKRSENKSVMIYAAVLGAMEKAEEAIQGLDIERFRTAAAMFDKSYEVARAYARATRDQQLLNQTFLLKHFMAELAAAGEAASMHDHREARKSIKKDIDYRRYLLQHHRGQPDHH